LYTQYCNDRLSNSFLSIVIIFLGTVDLFHDYVA
jgi:hypothetical protein